MIATCKKLVTDIQRDKDLDTKLPEYAELLGRQYNCYATVKGSMNYYTMKEVCDEQEDKTVISLSARQWTKILWKQSHSFAAM